MKITKLKTMMGEAQGLTAVELKIVERMRSETTKKTAETIREEALIGRMQMNQGGPRYLLEHSDRLPYVIFGATFGKNGFDEVNDVNPLLLLNLDCPEGLPQVEALEAACLAGALYAVVLRGREWRDAESGGPFARRFSGRRAHRCTG